MHSQETVDTIRAMAADGKADVEIASALNMTWKGVRSVRRRAGIKNRGRAAANQANAQSRPRYDWGAVDWDQSDADIARQLGCHWSAVGNARVRLGKVRCIRPSKIDPSKYGTETEAAKSVSVPRTTLQSAVDRGEIVHVETCGGTRLVEIASAKKWAKNRPNRGRKPQAEST